MLTELADDLGLPGPVELVTDARLDHADVERAGNQAVGLGMLGDELPDDPLPGGRDIGLLDAGIEPELGEKLPQEIGNGSGPVGSLVIVKTAPLLQQTAGGGPFLGETAAGGCGHARGKEGRLGRVVADRLDGAAFHGLLTESLLFWSLGLLVDIGVAAILVALEIGRGGFAAKIAIDALVVAVVGACNILGIFVGYVSHSDQKVKSAIPDCNGFFGRALPNFLVWSKSPP